MAGSLLLSAVVFFLLGRYAAPYTPQQIKPSHDDEILAQIGGTEITRGELRDRLEQTYGYMMLQRMLDREAVLRAGKKAHLSVTAAEIDDELKRMQAGYDSAEQFYRSMREQLGLSEQQLREDTFYKLLLDKIATEHIRISDQEVNQYLFAHPDEWESNVFIHLQEIAAPDQETALMVKDQLDQGADFARLAKKYSVGDTIPEDGDYGWVAINDPFIAPQVLSVAKNLPAGGIAGPIKVADKYAIIRVLDRNEPDEQEQRRIFAGIRKQLALEKAEPLPDIVAKLRKKYNAVVISPQYQ